MLNVVIYKVRQKVDVPRGLGFFPCAYGLGPELPELLGAFNDLPPQAIVVIASAHWGFGPIVALAFLPTYSQDRLMVSLHDVHTSVAVQLGQRRIMFRLLGTALGS